VPRYGPCLSARRAYQGKPAVSRHHPKLVHRKDGRWEVRCLQCQRNQEQATPLGIGIPVVNRVEAEGIARNDSDASLSRVVTVGGTS
jgi:hypothetical protein